MTQETKSACRFLLPRICAICLVVASTAYAADNSFDGTYRGKGTLTKGTDEYCPHALETSVTLRDDMITFTDRQGQPIVLSVKIAQDGSFDDINQGYGYVWLIKGQITGGVMELDTTRAGCEFHWSLTKK